MIVKDEASVISRCLKSVGPIVDYWIIVDTGSSDATPDVTREVLHDTPGELHHRPWVNFAHNRTEALHLARSHGDYTLIIDADDVLELPPKLRLPFLTADSYTIEIVHENLRHWRPQLVRSSLPWRYESVLHEFLSLGIGKNNQRVLPENRSQKRLAGIKIRVSEQGGARRRVTAAERYARDATVLEGALADETDPFLRARYIFYLAQSYHEAGEQKKALAAYQERATLGHWDQEVFVSLCRAAGLKAELGFDEEDVIASYMSAHNVRRDRAEALHWAARYCRIKQKYQLGFDLAKRALKIRFPEGGLFLENWIYQYGSLDEYAVNAYWIGRYDECLTACNRLLREGRIPPEMRERVEENARFAREKLSLRRT